MARLKLEPRDLEILRTLTRVHFMTSAEIVEAFFSSETAAYRRVRKLAYLNLVRRHTLGIPPRTQYVAWRVTASGIAAVLDHYPGEPVPDGLDDRLQRQSLSDLDHREALTRLYLGLVRGGTRERLDGTTCAQVRAWVTSIRRRADQIEWQADGEVVIEIQEATGTSRLVPDATVVARSRKLRLFIELDRSNKGLSRIREQLDRYALFFTRSYRARYGDGFTPQVVFVVRSQVRRANIARLAERALAHAGHQASVLVDQDAPGWLATTLLQSQPGESVPRPPVAAPERAGDAPELRTLGLTLLRTTDALLRDGSALFDELEQASPEVVAPWKRALAALYDVIHQPETTHGE